MRTKTPLLWLLLSLVATAAMAETFRGELSTRYRDRWGSSDYADQDVYTYFRLSFGDAAGKRGLGGAISLRWDKDLLTRANEHDDGRDDLRLYYAYVDVNKLERFDLRLGRQVIDEAEGFNLTGAKGVYAADWQHLRVGFFAGQPVSYSTSIDSKEWAGGFSWSLRPSERAQLRGSWIHVEDRDTDQNVVTLAFRRSFAQGSNLWATARSLDFDVFNEAIGGSWRIAPAQLLLTGTYRRQEDTNSSTSRYFGGLSTIIGPSLPYQQCDLSLSRPFGELAAVSVGGSRRSLIDADENRGNQEYSRLFLDIVLLEKLLGGFAANLDISRWDSDRDDNNTLAGSLSRRFGDHLELALGSFYARYDLHRVFDSPFETPVERFDVRSTYLRGDWRVRQRYRVRADLARTTDSTSDRAFYELELRVGLDLAIFGMGSDK
jgi:hypothetical protein